MKNLIIAATIIIITAANANAFSFSKIKGMIPTGQAPDYDQCIIQESRGIDGSNKIAMRSVRSMCNDRVDNWYRSKAINLSEAFDVKPIKNATMSMSALQSDNQKMKAKVCLKASGDYAVTSLDVTIHDDKANSEKTQTIELKTVAKPGEYYESCGWGEVLKGRSTSFQDKGWSWYTSNIHGVKVNK